MTSEIITAGSFTTHGYSETYEWGVKFAASLHPGDVVAVTGLLGAGKTVLCQGITYGLGYRGDVSSPSFVRMHSYPHTPPIYHVDFYLVKSESEGYLLGLDELSLAGGIVLIEWAQRYPNLLRDDCWWISLEWRKGEEDIRRLTLQRGKPPVEL